MIEKTSKQLFNWRRKIAVLVGIVLFVMILVAILPSLFPQLDPQYQKKAEIESDLRDTFPHLCSDLEITDCKLGLCMADSQLQQADELYQVSCGGKDSQFGPALVVDATTCKVYPISLTLASELEPEYSELHGKLRSCPASTAP